MAECHNAIRLSWCKNIIHGEDTLQNLHWRRKYWDSTKRQKDFRFAAGLLGCSVICRLLLTDPHPTTHPTPLNEHEVGSYWSVVFSPPLSSPNSYLRRRQTARNLFCQFDIKFYLLTYILIDPIVQCYHLSFVEGNVRIDDCELSQNLATFAFSQIMANNSVTRLSSPMCRE